MPLNTEEELSKPKLWAEAKRKEEPTILANIPPVPGLLGWLQRKNKKKYCHSSQLLEPAEAFTLHQFREGGYPA
eukprot:329301-Pelagomonas_calceolata.AAC.1